MKIIVLGKTGMLGSTVYKHFLNCNYNVYSSTRSPKLEQNEFYLDAQNKLIELPKADYVINCIGCIKQKDYSLDEYKKINVEFPHKLADVCQSNDIKLIHVSTDCVFSGARGNYSEIDKPDATDLYGVSKFLGEPRNCMVLRSSIIGDEIQSSYSLLSWTKSQRNQKVLGYKNHFWNGLTAAEFAKSCEKIIQKNLFSAKKFHVFSNKVSKFEMLQAFNEKFKLNLEIQPFETELVNKTLSTVYNLNLELQNKSFQEMIDNL